MPSPLGLTSQSSNFLGRGQLGNQHAATQHSLGTRVSMRNELFLPSAKKAKTSADMWFTKQVVVFEHIDKREPLAPSVNALRLLSSKGLGMKDIEFYSGESAKDVYLRIERYSIHLIDFSFQD